MSAMRALRREAFFFDYGPAKLEQLPFFSILAGMQFLALNHPNRHNEVICVDGG